jgi:hypothetical protein
MSAPGLDLIHDVLLDRETGCAHWNGPVSSDGYPVQYREGRQEVAHRTAFESCFVALPEHARLRRVCQSQDCVSPLHHILSAPRSVVRRLNWPLDEMLGVGHLLRAWRSRKPGFSVRWDTRNPLALMLSQDAVNQVASQLGVPAVLVLAAYADLVTASERQSRRAPDRTPPTAVVTNGEP